MRPVNDADLLTCSPSTYDEEEVARVVPPAHMLFMDPIRKYCPPEGSFSVLPEYPAPTNTLTGVMVPVSNALRV